MENRKNKGLYNLGTGQARTFEDLVTAVFSAMGKPKDIRYIDIPEDIGDKYQYYTQADTRRLIEAGYHGGFQTLEEAVGDYVSNYLNGKNYL